MCNITKFYCCNVQLGKIICDNDCGTYNCEICNKEYHIENNKLYKGHSDKCGI